MIDTEVGLLSPSSVLCGTTQDRQISQIIGEKERWIPEELKGLAAIPPRTGLADLYVDLWPGFPL